MLRRRRGLEGRAEILVVPVADDVEAVGIHRRHQHEDRVVADALRFVRLGRHQPPGELGRVLRAGHFGGVQAAVDPDDDLAFLRQRSRLGLADAARQRQPARDLLIPRAVLEVRFARDDRDDHVAALGALADALDADAIGRGVELREVVEELFVAGELVVVAGSEAEDVLGLGHRDRPRRRCQT